MDTFQLAKFYDKAHIFRAKYWRINFALGRWTTTVPRYRGARGKVMSHGANKLHMPYLNISIYCYNLLIPFSDLLKRPIFSEFIELWQNYMFRLVALFTYANGMINDHKSSHKQTKD